jgi:hypothetical protein
MNGNKSVSYLKRMRKIDTFFLSINILGSSSDTGYKRNSNCYIDNISVCVLYFRNN